MYGAIIGDLAGSIYEYSQIKNVCPIKCNRIIEKDAFYSDDTILTIAILDAIITGIDYGIKLREYVKKYEDYKPNYKPYFEHPFSISLMKWSNQQDLGTSIGNGAMMRISPIGFMFDCEEDVIRNVKLATIPSHNTKEAIDNATIVALIIFYARKGLKKDEIIKKLNLSIKKPNISKFNYTCNDTIDVCLFVLFNSNSYEDCIRSILLYGGDTDTNCAIVGSMAEALYGIDEDLINEANKHIPSEFKEILKLADKRLT